MCCFLEFLNVCIVLLSSIEYIYRVYHHPILRLLDPRTDKLSICSRLKSMMTCRFDTDNKPKTVTEVGMSIGFGGSKKRYVNHAMEVCQREVLHKFDIHIPKLHHWYLMNAIPTQHLTHFNRIDVFLSFQSFFFYSVCISLIYRNWTFSDLLHYRKLVHIYGEVSL